MGDAMDRSYQPSSDLIDLRRDLGELLALGVETDGGHHKQWVLEEIARVIGVRLPDHEAGIEP